MLKIDLHHGLTADDLLLTGNVEKNEATSKSCHSIDSLCHAFAHDGFVVFPNAISATVVKTLQDRLEDVLRGRYDRGSSPDKAPSPIVESKKSGRRKLQPLGYDGKKSSQNSRVLQIINIHKSMEMLIQFLMPTY